jgi:hypothetical protein
MSVSSRNCFEALQDEEDEEDVMGEVLERWDGLTIASEFSGLSDTPQVLTNSQVAKSKPIKSSGKCVTSLK